MKDYYNNFQILLNSKNLKNKDLKEHLGITLPALNLKMHGKRPFKFGEILKLMLFFNTDFDTIFVNDLSKKVKDVI